MEWLNFVN